MRLLKKAFVLGMVSFSLNALADQSAGFIKCGLTGHYINLSGNVDIDLDGSWIKHSTDKSVKYSISATDCEDITSVTFKKKDLEDLLSKKKWQIDGELVHSDPQIETLKMTVSCDLRP